MKPADDWHAVIAADSQLAGDAALKLRDDGFVVLPGPMISGGPAELAKAYDRAVANADPVDVSVRSSTRIDDFVNRGAAFDGLYVYPPLLTACCVVIGGPFKLSGMRGRTLEPGAPMAALHVDVKHRADGWPIAGFIVMVDAFDAENGATRFVPGSHLQPNEPGAALTNPMDAHAEEVLACGPAGSIIIFNGSVWHSHTANRSDGRRRSLQGHFVPRAARVSTDHAARMRPDTFSRIGELAKYLLDLT